MFHISQFNSVCLDDCQPWKQAFPAVFWYVRGRLIIDGLEATDTEGCTEPLWCHHQTRIARVDEIPEHIRPHVWPNGHPTATDPQPEGDSLLDDLLSDREAKPIDHGPVSHDMGSGRRDRLENRYGADGGRADTSTASGMGQRIPLSVLMGGSDDV